MPNIRVSTLGSSIAGPVITVTAMISLPTSMPAHLSVTAGIAFVVSFLGGKNQRKSNTLPHGFKAAIRDTYALAVPV